jgi:hypothetical protein
VLLFLIAWFLGTACAVGGSMLGAAFDNEHALFVGALLGGVIGCILAVRIAVWRRWVARERSGRVTLGAVIGFAIASAIATQTLSSPIGPSLSSLLIGLGAVIANRR